MKLLNVKNAFWLMENRINFPDASTMRSSSGEEMFFHRSNIDIGLSFSRGNFVKNIKLVGLKRLLRSYVSRYLYILRLWRLRNVYVLITLIENYDKVPKYTPSRILVWFFVTLAPLRRLVYGRAMKLRAKFSMTNYDRRRTVNNS